MANRARAPRVPRLPPQPPAWPAQGPYSVQMGMLACQCEPAFAPTLAMNIFGDSFSKNISDEDIKDVFKTLSELGANDGRVRLLPIVKRNIRAYNVWIKHMYRLGRDPTQERFLAVLHTEQMDEIASKMQQFMKDKK